MSKYAKTKESPCTERYARWCERSVGENLPPTRLVGGWQLAVFRIVMLREAEASLRYA